MYVIQWVVLSSFSFFLNVCCSQPKTFLRHDRNILLRKRSALEFPEGSALVFTLSFVKAVMVRKPKGYMSLLECDVPFKLPSASDRPLGNKIRYGRNVDVKSKWTKVFNRLGIDGDHCIRKILCEAEAFVGSTSPSIISKIIKTLFSSHFGEESCIPEDLQNCILPSLPKILMSILKLETFN